MDALTNYPHYPSPKQRSQRERSWPVWVFGTGAVVDVPRFGRVFRIDAIEKTSGVFLSQGKADDPKAQRIIVPLDEPAVFIA